jgi:hypothetical protein
MKKLVFIILCATQTACTTPARMSYQDLNHFKVDCNRRDEQWQFLESQKYSQLDRIKVTLQMTSVVGLASNAANGTYQDSADTINFRHEAMIKHIQREIRQQCPIYDANQQYLREREQRLNSR